MKKNLVALTMLGIGLANHKLNRNELDEALDSLAKSGNFENTNFETENFNMTGMTPQQRQAMLGLAHRARINQMAPRVGGTGDGGMVHTLITQSVGDLNLTVTRAGVNVNVPLPFILFGANDSQAGYASTLNGLLQGLPNGTTLVVSTDVAGNVVFTYTLAGNSDTVTVSNLGNINYKSFLASMNNNYFATKLVLVSISDDTQNLVQFAQPLKFGLLSSLGMSNANQLVFRSRTFSWMFRKDRIEVIMPEQAITPDFSFAMSIVAVDAFSIGFDFYMSRRINMNKI